MADEIPQPRGPRTTYLDIKAIRDGISNFTSDSPEDQLYGVWNSILDWVFPTTAGYIHIPQLHPTGYGETQQVYEFVTFDTDPEQKAFLMTRIIPVEREGVWLEESNNLGMRLKEYIGKRPVGQRRPVYGIVAMGRLVMFFTYSDENEGVFGWCPSPDLTRCYDLLLSAAEVQETLNFIRDAHEYTPGPGVSGAMS